MKITYFFRNALLAFLVITPLVTGALFLKKGQRLISQDQSREIETSLTHHPPLPERAFFERVFKQVSSLAPIGKIYGGTVPHHLPTAAPLIARFFQGLKNQKVETVVLLGPNHWDLGDSHIILSKAKWETPYGVLEPNLKICGEILKSRAATQDEPVFENEHSIYTLTPFIKKTFPNANFVPLAFKGKTPSKQAQEFGFLLSEILGEKSLVLVSADFTHEETSAQAEENDQESVAVLRAFNLERIYDLRTDANPALLALMFFLADKKAQATILDQSNSFKLGASGPSSVTSYITMYFTQDVTSEPLTLESIFSGDHQDKNLPPEELRTLIVTGDVLLARSVNFQIHKRKDPNYPFEKTAETLKSADLTLINLENPLIEGCPLTNEGMRFCGDLQNAQGLVYAGIDITNLANNHSSDHGGLGLARTVEILEENGISVIGTKEAPIIKNVRGLKFAFLAYDSVSRRLNQTKIEAAIKDAKRLADIVVTYFHWGVEYQNQPSRNQRELAHKAIESGADLVIGSHPHWIQGVEIYQGKVIAYSLGNFIFDQGWSRGTRQGVVSRFTFFGDRLVDMEFLPILIEDYAQPRFLEGEERQLVLDRMSKLSTELQSSANR